MRVHRTLSFPIDWGEPRLDWLTKEFRLIVNKSIRVALQGDLRSRVRLTRTAYADLSRDHSIYKQYIPSAFEVALGTLKAHRRRLRKGRRTSVPYLRKPMLKAENQSYRLDRETGRLRIPIRGTEGVQLHLPLSEWHRSFLRDPSWELGSLTIVPGKVLLVVRKEAPPSYEPTSAIALDTNEALARAVRFQPGALRDDVVIPLYDLLREGGGAREEPSGVELGDVWREAA
ncbi:MAG: hypothetical protein WC985_09025 [Thermoplasmata archaeon]